MPTLSPVRISSLGVAGITMLVANAAIAAGDHWTPEQAATAKWMIEQANAWSDQACGGKWVISDLLADDFRGTSPKGARYTKPSGEPPTDPKTSWSTQCRLDQADVHFVAADVAVMYGAESKTVSLPDQRSERRCLVWTDTWARRKGRWQIVAAQDTRVDCVAEPSHEREATRRTIEQNNARFTRAHVTGDQATIDAMFTADARSLPPGSLPVVGREAISKLTADYLAAGVAEFTETTTDFYGDGEVLIDQGDYVMVYGNERTRETGTYLNVWKREDGIWKIRTNIWNTHE